VFRGSGPNVSQVAVPGDASGVGMEKLPDRQVRDRWISAGSAERKLGLLRPGETAQLRELGTGRHAAAGTVIALSGSRVRQIQVGCWR
jgi:hypothetical protein